MNNQTWPFLNRLNDQAADLCDLVVNEADWLDVKQHSIGGANVLDFAIDRTGTIAAGIRLAEICLSGLAEITLHHTVDPELPLPRVQVTTDFPVQACIGSQYAGWAVSEGSFFAMCSGPARCLRGKEEVLTELGLVAQVDKISKTRRGRVSLQTDSPDSAAARDQPAAVGIFETNELPSETVIQHFADACSVPPAAINLCVARTASLPGTLQVVARSVETSLHKLHEIGFDLSTIKNAVGSAPLPPIAGDDLTALGWTNDAILYGGSVNLWVDTEDEAIEAIGQQLPSSSSSDFGEPFLKIFERYDRDFYKIDKLLFSPAHVVINNLKTGKSFSYGQVRNDILKASVMG